MIQPLPGEEENNSTVENVGSDAGVGTGTVSGMDGTDSNISNGDSSATPSPATSAASSSTITSFGGIIGVLGWAIGWEVTTTVLRNNLG